MKLRKFMAGALVATMVAGGSMMAFAEDTPQTGTATGDGSSVGHVNKDVLTVTLPTTGIDDVFDYWVDPERIIDLAGSLKDGTSITKNEDGVYFKNSDNTYSSSSNEIEFEGKNSVAVDVSVAAAVTSSAGGKDIALVADEDALAAATGPSLLMNMTVGTDTKTITSSGVTAKATLAGRPNNFEVKVESGEYKYVPKTDATGWDKTTVKLSGKTNNIDVTADMTAPQIKLTWTVAQADAEVAYGTWDGDVLWLAKDADTVFSSTTVTVEVSKDGTTYSALATDKYTYEDGWVSVAWNNITDKLGDSTLETAYVRVTDGTKKYVFK